MLHEITFPSFNERDTVYGWIYVPAAQPKGIVQLVHGFGEHSRRYLHLIVNLLEAGYIVAADDHVGHGKTAVENDRWGDWGDKGPHTMMEDEHRLSVLVKEKYPNLPLFFFGHSMGSMIGRDYMVKYGNELAGITLCGVTGRFPETDAVIARLQKLVAAGEGESSDPEIVQQFFGFSFARIPEGVKIGNEWICEDPYVQKDHAEDPFDAFTKPTSNRSMLDFAQMLKQVEGPQWAEAVPRDLPVYLIAGSEDPIGIYGTGFMEVVNWLEDTGHQTQAQLYFGYRHEIHNYTDIKDQVAWGIINFFDDIVAA